MTNERRTSLLVIWAFGGIKSIYTLPILLRFKYLFKTINIHTLHSEYLLCWKVLFVHLSCLSRYLCASSPYDFTLVFRSCRDSRRLIPSDLLSEQ